MILTEESKARRGEIASPPPAFGPVRLGAWALGPRAAAYPAGARSVGREEDCRLGGFSHESEHDLAVMVSDFWENGSSGAESRYSSDSDSGFPDLHHLADRVLFYKHALEHNESDLSLAVHSLILSINERDLQHAKDGQCSVSCIRQSLVKLLRSAGHDAAVCSSKWQGFDKVPGGDHEYIDVLIHGNTGVSDRLIVDVDLRSHFEIARAVEAYDSILSSLPMAYVGYLARLSQLLQLMVEAAKLSLKQNSMPLPPWRTLSYLQAKWYSPYEREPVPDGCKGVGGSDHRQCISHLRKLKASIWAGIETERLLKPTSDDKNRRSKLERRRLSLLRS